MTVTICMPFRPFFFFFKGGEDEKGFALYEICGLGGVLRAGLMFQQIWTESGVFHHVCFIYNCILLITFTVWTQLCCSEYKQTPKMQVRGEHHCTCVWRVLVENDQQMP